MELIDRLKRVTAEALAKIEVLDSVTALQDYRVSLLGKKGELTGILRGMGTLSPADRPSVGQLANEVRDQIEVALEAKTAALAATELAAKLKQERVDVTLPGRQPYHAHVHPLNRIIEEATEIFLGLGFSVAEGPEIESEYYNFEALNVPPLHPARDMQDSFYLHDGHVLRTQTSPVQVRTMQALSPHYPIRIISPGKVYRRDDDATHSPMFHQIEGLVIDKDISLAHLKSMLLMFARQMFGAEREIRLRPSYFPFTEPSAEVDVSCGTCGGRGCRVCKGTGWVEILGCGMVHPAVLSMSGYDPEEVNGFAFGMGVERIAMLKYNVEDLRHFFVNDYRFVRQF
ncbi:MAG: Phenylalanine--tRNA ligase alpha subunit [Firmicutes bacterium]|nr:Phenylalanine--tRNA ligase alpha subunit [candidate division NPL-UPA2 bacterium]